MNPLPLKSKVAYALGDTANNLVFQFSLLYLLFFYTDVMGLSPVAAGVVFVVARVVDAVSNPLMGYLVDHTKSPRGNTRVYLRFVPLPLAAATVLLFFVPFGLGDEGKFVWALVTYVLWSLLYTMVNIPYAAMTAQLTDDAAERTSVTTVRMIGMLAAVVVVSVATEPLVAAFPNPTVGWLAAAGLYAALAFVFFELCLRGTAKVPLVTPVAAGAPTYRLGQLVGILAKNTPALVVVVTFFLGASAEYIRESSVVYYVTYNMGNADLIPVFLGIVVLSMVGGNLLIPWVAEKWDKRGTYIAGVVVACVASLAFQFVPFDQTATIFALAAVSSLGFSVVSTMGWAMLPDTVEYGEWKTGVRTEGILYALFSFSQKLSTAMAGGVVAWTLATSGYQAGQAHQSAGALTGIVSTLGVLPLGFLVLSLVAVAFYRLDKAEFARIRQELDKGQT
jgi:sugar (glycoside-pentoside-hexuronide) transporter